MVEKHCIWCNRELSLGSVIYCSNGWLYCKHCKRPILDMTIQDDENFFKHNLKFIDKDTHIRMMLEGYEC